MRIIVSKWRPEANYCFKMATGNCFEMVDILLGGWGFGGFGESVLFLSFYPSNFFKKKFYFIDYLIFNSFSFRFFF